MGKAPLLRCEKSFCEKNLEVFLCFREFFKVFARFSKRSDVFGPIRIHSDPLGCMRTHSEAFGSVWTFSEYFDIFRIFELCFKVFGNNFYKKLFSRRNIRLLKEVGPRTGRVGPPSFGISYGSISFSQLSGYIVFCILLIRGASPSI